MAAANVRTVDEEFVSLEDLEARAAEIRDKNAQISGWVRKALEWLAGVERLSGEAKALPETIERVDAANEKLWSYLRDEDSTSRKTAWRALFGYYFGLALKTEEAVREQLERLVKAGFLKKGGNDLYAYGTSYTIPPESMLDKEGIEGIATMLKDLKNRVYHEVGKAREAKAEELLRSYNNNLEEMLAGEPGVYALPIPEENQKNENGEWIQRPGGVLVVESDGTSIKPLNAACGIEKGIAQAKELEVCLELATLSQDRPPEIPGLDSTTGAKTGAKTQLLWYLIQRAMHELEKEKVREGIKTLKKEMAERATVPPELWFVGDENGNHVDGICLVEYNGVWAWDNPDGSTTKIEKPFLLVRREKGKISIVEMPPHVNDFFAEYVGEYKEGDKFYSCPDRLGAMLRAAFRPYAPKINRR